MCVPVSNHHSDDEVLDEMNEQVREYPGIDEHKQRELVITNEHIAQRITPSAHGLIHTLHTWLAYLIIPVFAIANSGVALDGASLTGPIPLGVLLGLVLGKPIGITLATAIMLRLGVGALPKGMRFSHVPALAAL